jgi:hypothetical protein
MALSWTDWPAEVLRTLQNGTVIPAHLLALDANRQLDRCRQRALTRYYIDAGVGGLAVGVHSTQFAIRDVGLYEPVLRTAAKAAAGWTKRPLVLIAGLVGKTEQALREARIGVDLGYHGGLLSLAAFRGASEDELIGHCRAVASVIPLVGFYLQPAVGGIVLSRNFWRRFAEIEQVVAIKIAPFDRYKTLDVVEGVAAARAENRVTLYTGNDDNIVLDLVVPFMVRRKDGEVAIRVKGGLLGHWSVWTKGAVDMFVRIRAAMDQAVVDRGILALASKVTDCNAAFFDVANGFRGCIAGCHEVLRRQGLFDGIWCLDPEEGLSAGQAAAIERVMRLYPELGDDEFVASNRDRWLA